MTSTLFCLLRPFRQRARPRPETPDRIEPQKLLKSPVRDWPEHAGRARDLAGSRIPNAVKIPPDTEGDDMSAHLVRVAVVDNDGSSAALVSRTIRLKNPGGVEAAITTVSQVRGQLGNASSGNSAADRKDRFLRWCDNWATPQLGNHFPESEEIFTAIEETFRRLALAPPMSEYELNTMLARDWRTWDRRLEWLCAELESLRGFTARPGRITVLDTSALMEGALFTEYDWHALHSDLWWVADCNLQVSRLLSRAAILHASVQTRQAWRGADGARAVVQRAEGHRTGCGHRRCPGNYWWPGHGRLHHCEHRAGQVRHVGRCLDSHANISGISNRACDVYISGRHCDR